MHVFLVGFCIEIFSRLASLSLSILPRPLPLGRFIFSHTVCGSLVARSLCLAGSFFADMPTVQIGPWARNMALFAYFLLFCFSLPWCVSPRPRPMSLIVAQSFFFSFSSCAALSTLTGLAMLCTESFSGAHTSAVPETSSLRLFFWQRRFVSVPFPSLAFTESALVHPVRAQSVYRFVLDAFGIESTGLWPS